MCKQCEIKPVYEFTNQRKLCAKCFIRYFQKKVLYIIRKFGMIKSGEIVGYVNNRDFRDVVLEDVLKMFAKKAPVELVRLPAHSYSEINNEQLIKKSRLNKIQSYINSSNKFRAKQGKLSNKIAIGQTVDLTAYKIINTIINKNVKNLKDVAPVEKINHKIIIKPLYLFLDKEVLLYAKLRKLKFRKEKEGRDKVSKFVDELEKKHPEVKRAVVKGYLKVHN